MEEPLRKALGAMGQGAGEKIFSQREREEMKKLNPKYVEKLLKACSMDKASPSMTPGDPEPSFSSAPSSNKKEATPMNNEDADPSSGSASA